MNRTHASIEKYLEEVKKAIHHLVPCDDFINSLREELLDNLEANPDCTVEQLIEEFGKPETIAKDFLENHKELQPHKISKSKKTRNIIIVTLIIALAAVSWYLWDIHQQTQAMATDVIIIEN